jgi:hypothetical protein
MSYRTPADMHADGVYFNEQLLTIKIEQERRLEKLKQLKKTSP